MSFTSGTHARTHTRNAQTNGDKTVFWSCSSFLWSQSQILFTFSILCLTLARVTIVLISSRPSWRQWACFSPCGLGLGRRGLYRAAKSHLFWCAFLLICVTLASAICIFCKGGASLEWNLLWLLFICCVCQQAAMQTGGTGSLFCVDNLPDWVTALILLSASLCWGLLFFYWFVVKSHDSVSAAAPDSLIPEL